MGNNKSGLKKSWLEGKYVACLPPYGYLKSDDGKSTLIIDAYAAEVVRRIFTDFMNGKSTSDIAKDLNDEGYQTTGQYLKSKGYNIPRISDKSKWNYQAVQRILEKRVYTGDTEHFDDGKSVVINGTHEPIIDRMLYQSTLDEMNRRQGTYEPSKNYGAYTAKDIMAGKLFCKQCGKPLYFICDSELGSSYVCAAKYMSGKVCFDTELKAEVCNAMVMKQILERGLSDRKKLTRAILKKNVQSIWVNKDTSMDIIFRKGGESNE